MRWVGGQGAHPNSASVYIPELPAQDQAKDRSSTSNTRVLLAGMRPAISRAPYLHACWAEAGKAGWGRRQPIFHTHKVHSA